jgi:hypothetical protein
MTNPVRPPNPSLTDRTAIYSTYLLKVQECKYSLDSIQLLSFSYVSYLNNEDFLRNISVRVFGVLLKSKSK